MQYDQSWMGYGLVGGLEAGAISTVVAALLFALLHRLTRGRWHHGAQLAWAWLIGVLLSASGDLFNMFYFNYARLQSLQLLRAKLADVHDADGMPLRVVCELLGVTLGVFLAWLLLARGRDGEG